MWSFTKLDGEYNNENPNCKFPFRDFSSFQINYIKASTNSEKRKTGKQNFNVIGPALFPMQCLNRINPGRI